MRTLRRVDIDYSELGQRDFTLEWMRTPDGVTKMHRGLAVVMNMLEKRGGGSVLDVGCFNGYAYNDLLKNCRVPFDYHGIDMNAKAVDFAKQWNPGANYKVMDLYALSDADQYDFVFASRVLIHLDDWEGALRALVRAARVAVVLVLRITLEDAVRRIDGVMHRDFSTETLLAAADRLGCKFEVTKPGERGKYRPVIFHRSA